MKFNELIHKELSNIKNDSFGFKKFPRAKYAFTQERAEEFSHVTMEQFITDPYFLGQDIVDGMWPKVIDILLNLEEERKKRLIHTFLYTSGIGAAKSQAIDSIMFTSEGILYPNEIFEKDEIKLQSESGFRDCTYMEDEGIKKSIKITCHSGAWNHGTPHHRIRVLTPEFEVKWKRLDEIQKGDYTIRVKNKEAVYGNLLEIDGIKLTPKICEFIGLWVAEGWYYGKGGEQILLCNGDSKSELLSLIAACPLTIHRYRFDRGAHYFYLRGDLAKFIKRNIKTGSRNKVIPQFIRESTKENLIAFLRGLFAGDGSFYGNSDGKKGGEISYSSVSYTLAHEVFQILWSFGIKSRISAKKVNGIDYYRLLITNKWSKILFRDLIGCTFKRKEDRLKDICFENVTHRDNDREIIPYAKNAAQQSWENIPSHLRKRGTTIGDTIRSIYISREKQATTKRAVRRMFELPICKDTIHPLLRKIVEEDWWLDPVEKIEHSSVHMYDFTVDGDPSYISNGFINHNTSIASILLAKQIFDILIIPDHGKYFPNITKGKAIAFVILSKDESSAKGVTFKDILPIFGSSPFFSDYFPTHIPVEKILENPSRLPSELRFPRNIVLFPGTGQAASALGYNIFGCFTGDTKILMADDSFETLENLCGKKDLHIKGFDNKNFIDVNTAEVIETKTDDVYEVEMEDGYKFKCTKDHLFLTFLKECSFLYMEISIIYALNMDVFSSNGHKKIKNMAYMGKEKVYDVVGSTTQNFLLENGTVVHNSTLDEMNDMAYVEKSKRATMKQYYSAAEEAHREIYERMNSRFPFKTHWRKNIITGIITCIGQARYPNSFSEMMIKRSYTDNGIYVLKMPRWKVQPQDNFEEKTFYFNITHRRIVTEIDLSETKQCACGNDIDRAYLGYDNNLTCGLECYKKSFGDPNIQIEAIPMDFYEAFRDFPEDSMRDIGGWPTISIKPLIENTENFFACMRPDYQNPFDDRFVSLITSFEPEYNTKYYMHLDGSEGGDGYGICMCHINGWTDDSPALPVVKIDFMGSPNRKSYGEDFKPELLEVLIKELVKRKFDIQLVTYDRATNIRMIKDILEPEGVPIEPMSIDSCANYPIKDYSLQKPPYIKSVSTDGAYDSPMLDFKHMTETKRLIVPFSENWANIPFAFEHNAQKKKVVKLPGAQDDLGQAVAGAVFNCLNNEKDEGTTRTIEKEEIKKWTNQVVSDDFDEIVKDIKTNLSEPDTRKKEKQFRDDVPYEIDLDDADDFYDNIDNKYYV